MAVLEFQTIIVIDQLKSERLLHCRCYKQIPGELTSADARQPATDIITISLPVRIRAVQRLRLQAPQVVIHVRGKCHLRVSQRMLDLGESVRMVIAVGIDFRPCGLSTCRVRMRHRGRLVRKGIGRICDLIPARQIILHPLRLASLYVVVMGDIKLITAARYRYHAAGQFPLAVARGVVRELARREPRTTQFCTCTT